MRVLFAAFPRSNSRDNHFCKWTCQDIPCVVFKTSSSSSFLRISLVTTCLRRSLDLRGNALTDESVEVLHSFLQPNVEEASWISCSKHVVEDLGKSFWIAISLVQMHSTAPRSFLASNLALPGAYVARLHGLRCVVPHSDAHLPLLRWLETKAGRKCLNYFGLGVLCRL